MYEQHFRLKKRPFRKNASGTDVFVGPQIATIMAGLKKALAGRDSIVTVSGPVGSGKTTLVNRALESISDSRTIVHLARMRLDSKDVLEFLLDELGVQNRPDGTIQRFGLFRRSLKALEANNARVFIAVEDAAHLGAETLAELEALTASDAGESEGASVVLMGDENLHKMLVGPQLARMQQRIRNRYQVAPFCAAELRGYLRHCFRLAGGDFERVFEVNAAPLLHHLSGGILRINNNLVESVLAAASDQDLSKVSSELLARVAENEYGLSAAGFDLRAQPAPLPVLTPDLVIAQSLPAAAAEPEPPLPAPKPMAVPEQVIAAPVIVFAQSAVETPPQLRPEIEIPEFIQDTLPDLEILAPHFAAVTPTPDPEPEWELEAEAEAEPEPVQDQKIAAESDGDEVPAWDRDPTVAELRPDIAALEAALAFGRNVDPHPVATDSQPAPKPRPKVPDVIPEITLDHAISQRIANNLIDEPGEISAPASAKAAPPAKNSDIPTLNLPPKTNRKADAELEKIAAELAKAKSLEDVDDRMAETLFGDEINFVAAQFHSERPRNESANDEYNGVAKGEQVANGSPTPDYEVTLQAPKKLDDGGMDLSASQRLKTVRALNADLHPSLREPQFDAATRSVPAPTRKPESIEDQINTSMTQTLKALDVRPPVTHDDMDEDSKRGFFSRFKRS